MSAVAWRAPAVSSSPVDQPSTTSEPTAVDSVAVNVTAKPSVAAASATATVTASGRTVMVTVAAAADSWSSESVTLNVKVAVPFQFATGSNTSVPRSAATIASSVLTAASGLPAFRVPWAVSGREAIFTDFSVWPSSGSLNASVKSLATKVSAVSSSVLLLMAEAVGASFTALTVMVTVAASADSPSWESVTL